MQNWQKDRNYRKYKNEDDTFRYVISIEGEDVEVTDEVYEAYSQADRRERYTDECEIGLLLSLDRLAEDGMQLSYLTDRHIESAEDTVLHNMEQAQLLEALAHLDDDERELVKALFFRNISARELARESDVYHRTIIYRRDKILEKLRRFFAE